MSFIDELQSKVESEGDLKKKAADVLLTHYFSELDAFYCRLKQCITELAKTGKYEDRNGGKYISGLLKLDVPDLYSSYPSGRYASKSSSEEKLLCAHQDDPAFLFSILNTPLSISCSTCYGSKEPCISGYHFSLYSDSTKAEKHYNFFRTNYYSIPFKLNNMGQLTNKYISDLARKDGIKTALVCTYHDSSKVTEVRRTVCGTHSFFFDGEEIRSKWDNELKDDSYYLKPAIFFEVTF